MTLSNVQLILAERLARGEITEEEHDRVLAKIRSGDQGRPAATPILDSPNAADTPLRDTIPNQATPHTPTLPEKRGIVGRFWRGEVSLAITVWGGGVAFIGFLLIVVILDNAIQNGGAHVFLVACVLAGNLFLAAAIYRSGQAYRWKGGRPLWGRGAQLLSLLLIAWGLVVTVGSLRTIKAGSSGRADTPAPELDAYIATWNKEHLSKSDNSMRYENAYRTGLTVIYPVTYLNSLNEPPLDSNTLRFLNAGWQAKFCVGKEKLVLAKAEKMTYLIKDETNRVLADISVSINDCPASR